MEDAPTQLTYAETALGLMNVLRAADKRYLQQVVTFWSHGSGLSELQSSSVLLTLALYGEVRGESEIGQRAVFEVIANRALERTKGNLDLACLEPWQFSCFNKGDYSLQRAMITDMSVIRQWLRKSLEYVMEWNAGEWEPTLDGATIYCTAKAAVKQFERYVLNQDRSWNFDRMQRVTMIGRHVFFRVT